MQVKTKKYNRTDRNVKQEIVSVSDEIIMSDEVNQLDRDIKVI